MPLNNFHQTQAFSKDGDHFISDINYWELKAEKLTLVKCEFFIEHYKAQLYAEYGIALPSTIENAVDKRQAEFLAGRFVAQLALLKLGFSQNSLPNIGFDKNRCPVWPKGYVGSIAHSSTSAICVLSNNKSHLGLDIEDVLSPDSASQISYIVHNDVELNLLSAGCSCEAEATTIIFSAKESLFKALYPKLKVYFDFDSARVVSVDRYNSTLKLKLLDDFVRMHGIPQYYYCRYTILDEVVITLID